MDEKNLKTQLESLQSEAKQIREQLKETEIRLQNQKRFSSVIGVSSIASAFFIPLLVVGGIAFSSPEEERRELQQEISRLTKDVENIELKIGALGENLDGLRRELELLDSPAK